MLKKAYLEITDVCNLDCSFCHKTSRRKGFIRVEDFRIAADKLRAVTEYLYLHLMGEPLLHPELAAILGVCGELGFKTVITTNGVLLKEKKDVLLSSPAVYKVSVSLHAFEANGEARLPFSLTQYVSEVCSFADEAAKRGILVSLRLWNNGGKNAKNEEILSVIDGFFPGEHKKNRRGVTLREHIFLEYGDKFDWPDTGADERNVRFCMGLRDQVGVLFDGTVVPCCLDADGNIPLGNIFTESIEAILSSPRAKAIYDGFTNGRPPEELCRRCGYAERFSKT